MTSPCKEPLQGIYKPKQLSALEAPLKNPMDTPALGLKPKDLHCNPVRRIAQTPSL